MIAVKSGHCCLERGRRSMYQGGTQKTMFCFLNWMVYMLEFALTLN